MTLHPLSAGEGYRYLTRSVACGDQQRGLDGLTDYYALSGLPPGRWYGRGLDGLDLAGTVAEDDMRRLYGVGVHPRTGERLGRPFPTFAEGVERTAVAGYDLTFSPVKSVSVFWALTDDEYERREVHAAHRAAVEEVLDFLQDEAALTRTGPHGLMQVDTRGLTVACFDHWESRCGDPDLHTHAVVSAKVQTLDGRWQALDGQALHHIAVAASEMYNTRLEGQLNARLNVAWRERAGGRDGKEPIRELVGVPDSAIERFSTRRGQVEGHLKVLVDAYRETYGREPDEPTLQHLAETAVTTDRPEKSKEPRPLDRLRGGWKTAGERLDVVAGRGRGGAGTDVPGLAGRVLAKVEERRATYTRWNVHAEAERALRRAGVDVAEQRLSAEAVVAEVLGPLSLPLTAPEVAETPVELRRRSGQSVFEKHAAERFTTGRTLDAEERLVTAGRTFGAPKVEPALTEAVLALRHVSGEQADAVRRLACEDRALDLLVGPAGTGKTTTLAALVDVWQAGGGSVLGLAPSAAAAAVLAEETGVATENVAKWLHETAKPAAVGGWAMRLLEAEVGGARLSEAWRFGAEWERDAAAALRVGSTAALVAYDGAGRLADGTDVAMREAAFRGWQADMAAGRSAVLVTAAGVDVVALSEQARAVRVEAGQVEADGVPLRTGSRAGVGDQVVTRANDRRVTACGGRDFVKNGDCWTVTGRTVDGSLDVRHAVHGGTVTLTPAYVGESVELAYAATVHRAQGMTVDAGHLLLTPEMTREALYVGMTRGRELNAAYVVTSRADVEAEHRPAQVPTRDEVLGRVLAREGAERGATETLRAELDRAESLDVLVPRYDAAAARAASDRLRSALTAALGRQRAAGVLADPAWPALAQALAERETAGQSAADVLTRVAAARELDTAESAAQVLLHRLEREPVAERSEPVPASALAPAGPMRDYLAAYETAIADRRAETLVPDTAAETGPEARPEPAPLTVEQRLARAQTSRAAAEAAPSYAEQIAALRATLEATAPPAPEVRRDEWADLHHSHDLDHDRDLGMGR